MTVHQFLRIVEIRTKLISLSGVLIGTAYSAAVDHRIVLSGGIVMLCAVFAVDMATTGFNSFFDFFHGVDRVAVNREKDKVLVHQNVPAGLALITSLALYGVAAVFGIWPAVLTSPVVILVGTVCMLVGFLYNTGPLPISRTPAGELFAGSFLGWVLVTLTIYVQRGRLEAADLLVGVPSTLIGASILTVNDTCDIDGDRRAGRRTLSIMVGRTGGETLVYLLGAGAFLSASALSWYGILPRIVLAGALLAALVSVPVYFRMHVRGYSHTTKGPSMGSISRIFLYFALGITVPLTVEALGWTPL